jgi:hypothetical protein
MGSRTERLIEEARGLLEGARLIAALSVFVGYGIANPDSLMPESTDGKNDTARRSFLNKLREPLKHLPDVLKKINRSNSSQML